MVLVNNRDKLEWHEGMTVQDVLDAMNYTFSLMTVSVNNRLIREEDYETVPVPGEARIICFHLAHGG